MNILIQGWTPSPTVDMPEHVQNRLYFAVGRFATRIQKVSVRLKDCNGSKGGIDKRCRMIFTLEEGDELVVEKYASEWTEAVNAAAACAGRVVARTVNLSLKGRRTNVRQVR